MKNYLKVFVLITILILTSTVTLAAGVNENDVTATAEPQPVPNISYRTHSSNIGWEPQFVRDSQTSGAVGKSNVIECLELKPENLPLGLYLTARGHVTNIGWQPQINNEGTIGTTGQALSLQAIELNLEGPNSTGLAIYYRTHVSNLGWLGWAKNGETAGTTGLNLPIEAVEIRLVPAGTQAPEQTRAAITNEELNNMTLTVNLQQPGGNVLHGVNGSTISTADPNNIFNGMSATLESPFDGSSISYQAFISNVGWCGWNSNGGAVGDGTNQIEAVQFALEGPIQTFYDVYYRVQSNRFKWLDWAQNGQHAGTKDGNMNVIAMEVKLVRKGQGAPGSTYRPFLDMPSGEFFQGRGIFVWIAQQMVFVQDERNQIIFLSDCVTGTPNTENATPVGNFSILKKSRNTWLSGPDYYSHVDYWIPFIGHTWGFHDADWREDWEFGNDIYLHDGSHGCINMRDHEIGILNNIIRIGDPVIIR